MVMAATEEVEGEEIITGEVEATEVTTTEVADIRMGGIRTTGGVEIRTEEVLRPETGLINNTPLLATLTKGHLSRGIRSRVKGIGHLHPMPMISSANHISHQILTAVPLLTVAPLLVATRMVVMGVEALLLLLLEAAEVIALEVAILTTTEVARIVMEEINPAGMEARPVMEDHPHLRTEDILQEVVTEEAENGEVITAQAVGTLQTLPRITPGSSLIVGAMVVIEVEDVAGGIE